MKFSNYKAEFIEKDFFKNKQNQMVKRIRKW